MNTWIPLWTSTVDSTLWEEPIHVRVMFLTLLMLRDPDHVVRQPFRRLVKKAGLDSDLNKSVALARDALKILSEPDHISIDNQEFEGRRIKQVADGWLVLNGAKYDEEMRYLAARIRKTRKQRERRQELRQRSGPTMAERAIEEAETLKDRLRAEELADGAPRGAYGSGAQAQSPTESIESSAALTSAGDSGAGVKGDLNGSAEAPVDDTPDPDAMP